MSNHYYLVAALEPLALGQPVTSDLDDFLGSCQCLLGWQDLEQLQLVVESRAEEGSHPALRQWVTFEASLRNALARQRAAERRTDARPFLRDNLFGDTLAENLAAQALATDNPLERELLLDRARWQVLDDIAAADPFGLGTLLTWLLKYQLARKWQQRTQSAGQEQREQLSAQLLASALEPAGR